MSRWCQHQFVIVCIIYYVIYKQVLAVPPCTLIICRNQALGPRLCFTEISQIQNWTAIPLLYHDKNFHLEISTNNWDIPLFIWVIPSEIYLEWIRSIWFHSISPKKNYICIFDIMHYLVYHSMKEHYLKANKNVWENVKT